MKPGTEIVQELQELNSTLAQLERVNVFSVPEGYFETISTIILLNSKQAITAEVPQGYFDQLADSILNKIKAQQPTAAEELRQLSPMLYSIQDSNVYKVPAGYFDTVAVNVLQELQPKVKVVKMGWRSSVLKYAAAAVVVSFITLSVFKFANKPVDKQNNIAAVVLDPSIQKGRSMNDSTFDAALNKLSADDIASYLEKNGNETDVAELSTDISDSTLPKQEDYLTDQKALEQYLSDDISKNN
jgi:hypothetical protein